MEAPSAREITGLLQAWSAGDERAFQKLMPLVYQELHRVAQRYMEGEHSDQTLQTTALTHEAYLRLVGVRSIDWQNRTHFFAISAQLMRRILTNFARSRHYQKRGGGATHVSFDEAFVLSAGKDPDLVALDVALDKLSVVDPRKSRVVELRFVAGLSAEETAEVLKVSRRTVMSDWKLAKVWLLRELKRGNQHGT